MTTATAILGPLPAPGPPQSVIRTPSITVVAAGNTLSNVMSARHSLGLDLAVGEATFVVPTTADLQGATFWRPVSITLTAGGGAPTWEGIITDIDYTLWPRAVTVTCHGYLIYAQRQKNPQTGGTPLSGSDPGLSPGASPPLTILGASGGTDGDIVTALLQFCEPTGAPPTLTIDDTGQLLGTLAPNSFIWAEKETVLSYIQRLDEATPGWRTYDELGGVIRRLPIDATPDVTPSFIFTEGIDIFSGQSKQTVLTMANRIVVTGYDDGLGAGPVTFVAQADNAAIPTPPRYQGDELSSPMIEYALDGDRPVGTGLSCESAARYLLGQFNRVQVRVEFVTPRDDVIEISATIAVHTISDAPDRLGVYNSFYVQHVDREIDERGAFSQTIVCLSGEAGSGPGEALYGSATYGVDSYD